MEDEYRRYNALEQAVTIHRNSDHDDADVLATATAYLGWLRKPTPPATLRLRVGPVIEK